MESSLYYNTKAINFIKILNRILVAFLLIVAVLIFALSINDTVTFSGGEIYSDTPSAPNQTKIFWWPTLPPVNARWASSRI